MPLYGRIIARIVDRCFHNWSCATIWDVRIVGTQFAAALALDWVCCWCLIALDLKREWNHLDSKNRPLDPLDLRLNAARLRASWIKSWLGCRSNPVLKDVLGRSLPLFPYLMSMVLVYSVHLLQDFLFQCFVFIDDVNKLKLLTQSPHLERNLIPCYSALFIIFSSLNLILLKVNFFIFFIRALAFKIINSLSPFVGYLFIEMLNTLFRPRLGPMLIWLIFLFIFVIFFIDGRFNWISASCCDLWQCESLILLDVLACSYRNCLFLIRLFI